MNSRLGMGFSYFWASRAAYGSAADFVFFFMGGMEWVFLYLLYIDSGP